MEFNSRDGRIEIKDGNGGMEGQVGIKRNEEEGKRGEGRGDSNKRKRQEGRMERVARQKIRVEPEEEEEKDKDAYMTEC